MIERRELFGVQYQHVIVGLTKRKVAQKIIELPFFRADEFKTTALRTIKLA